jgi:hypothetical protein
MSREKYQKLQEELLDIFQTNFKYEIKDSVQEIDLRFDAEKIKEEILSFIATNKYGYKNVSLRAKYEDNDWDNQNKVLYETAFSTHSIDSHDLMDQNINPEKYIKWHPKLASTSYVHELTKLIEDISGLNVSKVSLRWMAPSEKYRLHADPEPCRIHIPIVTNDRAYFISEEKIHTMQYGKAYHLLPIVEHGVINYGATPRLHLIFSTYMSKEITKKMMLLSNSDTISENLFSSIENNSGIDKNSLGNLIKIEMDAVDKKVGLDVFKLISKHIKRRM